MGKMSEIKVEIRAQYDDENFPSIIRKVFVEKNDGLDKRAVEIKLKIKLVDTRMLNKVCIVFVGAICQITSFSHLTVFAEIKSEWLRKFTQLLNGKTPSKDTFRQGTSMPIQSFYTNSQINL